MSRAQFFIILIAIIPLFGCFFVGLGNDTSKLRRSLLKLVPILFLSAVIGAFNVSNFSMAIGQSVDDLNLLFVIDNLAVVTLFLLGFLWLIFAIYSDRFLELCDFENGNIRLFFALTIFFLTPLILSGNLVTIFFFQSCLIFLVYVFGKSSSKTAGNGLSRALSFSLYCEIALLFFAIIATQKFFGTTDFSKIKISAFANGVHHSKVLLLFGLYILALFLPIIFSCFFLYRDSFVQPIGGYSVLFFVRGFAGFYVLIRLCSVFFPGGNVSGSNGEIVKNFWHIFEVVILANSLLMLAAIVSSKNLKTLFFYLFFQQLGFNLFAVTAFALFNPSMIYLPLLSFSLLITILFCCLSNFILFLAKAENKSLRAIFYKLRVNSLILVFAVVSLCGLTPSVALVENFSLVKIISRQNMTLSAIILLVNFIGVAVVIWKIILPIFSKEIVAANGQKTDPDLELARNIDLDSALILTTILVVIVTMLCPIFFYTHST